MTPRTPQQVEGNTPSHPNRADIIVALITPPGVGGIAGIRLAGASCLQCFDKHFLPASKDAYWSPFLLRVGKVIDHSGTAIDEVMAVFMPEGKSYTGENQIEIFCHGSRHLASRIIEMLIASGARPAEPGEFTKMAFLSGRIDLAEAEAVVEMVQANTDYSLKVAREHLLGAYSEHISGIREKLIDIAAEVEAAIDYPDEGLNQEISSKLIALADNIIHDISNLLKSYAGGRILREGFRVAISGRPNAGKSSLFNLLVKHERALVSPTPGTTRDYLTEWIDLSGHAVCLIDTAGIRGSGGKIEKSGQQRARELMKEADLVIWLFEAPSKLSLTQLESDRKKIPNKTVLVVCNKSDKIKQNIKLLMCNKYNLLSCKTEHGLTELLSKLSDVIEETMPDMSSGLVVTSSRHKAKLASSLKSLRNARRNIERHASPELTAADLRECISAIDEITGRVYTEEILGRIFSKFCIGK